MVNLADGPSMVATKLREIDEELQTIVAEAQKFEIGKEFVQVSMQKLWLSLLTSKINQ